MDLLKRQLKQVMAAILGWQVRRLVRIKQIKVIGVAGSYGKTSTKTTIATILSAGLRVRFQDGNYNDLVSVPLIFFGETMPRLFSPVGWLTLMLRNEKQIRGNYPYDVVVAEIGTDGPGQVSQFGNYLDLDLAILTAVGYEHMEHFNDLMAVAGEELAVAKYAKSILVNLDLCDPGYLTGIKHLTTYGKSPSSSVRIDCQFKDSVYEFKLLRSDKLWLKDHYRGVDSNQLYSIAAGAICGQRLGLTDEVIRAGIAQVRPVSGRMQVLKGVNKSIILDDTYNSSPAAAKAALDVLYALKSPQKIALLGSMNELGRYSEQSHADVGKYCNPKELSFVITLGRDANQFLAVSAEQNGCKVVKTKTPYEAAEFLKKVIKKDTVVLAKGSQNGVFAEEAVKLILATPEDSSKLVRQSQSWQDIKAKFFQYNS